jgi:hypothetical protein
MVNIIYPSRDFPAPLPVAVEIPEGWEAVHLPNMLMSARSVDDHEGVRPNVTVGWQRVGLDADPEEYLAGAARVGGASYQNYRLLESKTGATDGVSVLAYRHRFDSSGGIPTFQETLVIIGPATTERSRDLFQVTATRHEQDETSAELISTILDSFTILDLTSAPDEAPDSEDG